VRASLIALEEGSGPALGVYHVELGTDLPPGASSDVLVGRALADELGLAPGAEVELAPPERAARRECVEGELRERADEAAPARGEVFRVAGVLAPEGVGRKGKGAVVVVGFTAGRRLFADVHVEAQFWLERDGAVDRLGAQRWRCEDRQAENQPQDHCHPQDDDRRTLRSHGHSSLKRRPGPFRPGESRRMAKLMNCRVDRQVREPEDGRPAD
jgi:hypothetical protein